MAVRKPAATPRAPRGKTSEYEVPEPIELTAEESWAMYDARARRLLGISAEEFEQRWDAGELSGPEENQDAVAVWMLRIPRPGS